MRPGSTSDLVGQWQTFQYARKSVESARRQRNSVIFGLHFLFILRNSEAGIHGPVKLTNISSNRPCWTAFYYVGRFGSQGMALYSYKGKSKGRTALHLLVPVVRGRRATPPQFLSFLAQALAVHKFFHGEIAFFPGGNIITNHSH